MKFAFLGLGLPWMLLSRRSALRAQADIPKVNETEVLPANTPTEYPL